VVVHEVTHSLYAQAPQRLVKMWAESKERAREGLIFAID
jgi:hypothetical protein